MALNDEVLESSSTEICAVCGEPLNLPRYALFNTEVYCTMCLRHHVLRSTGNFQTELEFDQRSIEPPDFDIRASGVQ